MASSKMTPWERELPPPGARKEEEGSGRGSERKESMRMRRMKGIFLCRDAAPRPRRTCSCAADPGCCCCRPTEPDAAPSCCLPSRAGQPAGRRRALP
eukprot:6090809-Pyramimonas_sp.AAC.1